MDAGVDGSGPEEEDLGMIRLGLYVLVWSFSYEWIIV